MFVRYRGSAATEDSPTRVAGCVRRPPDLPRASQTPLYGEPDREIFDAVAEELAEMFRQWNVAIEAAGIRLSTLEKWEY